jgi:hypothetical protein
LQRRHDDKLRPRLDRRRRAARTAAIAASAPGVFSVISITRTPPAARARAAPNKSTPAPARMIAINPASTICLATDDGMGEV